INYPDALYSQPTAVNDHGKVVGYWQDDQGTLHGYYWDGTNYTSLDYPGAGGTQALGINNAGVISGLYLTNQGTQAHGFILDSGTYYAYEYPGFEGQTDGTGINNNGETTGYYSFSHTNGFVNSSGTFSSFSYPGAETTLAYALNDSGEAVGNYRIGVATSP